MAMVKDVVCGMEIEEKDAFATHEFQGRTYHFCSQDCAQKFLEKPGIYVAPDNTRVQKKWRGIGIRIEDDVAVSKDGCEVLTAAVPKTVAAIEALMAGK